MRRNSVTEGGMSRRSFVKLGGSAACAAGLGALAAVGGSMLAPETAQATVVGDQTPLTDEEIEEAIRNGLIKTEFPEDSVVTYASKDYAVRTYGGKTRYETNALQVMTAFSSCEWVIVASGAGYADSIGAAGLAGALDCPIVLTEAEKLSDYAVATIKTLGAKNVVLLGGTSVASEQVEQSLAELLGSADAVVRLCGEDRYGTQMAVYEFGSERGLWTGDTAVVSNATGFADALSVSPLSFKLKAPVFFVDETGYLPEEQKQAILECGKKRFILTGGQAVMSDDVAALLGSLGTVVRLAGNTRYETSQKIAEYAVRDRDLGMSWNGLAVASGLAPYDALGGGPVQGKLNSVLVLMDENDYHSEPSIPFSKQPSMKFFGGSSIFSSAYKMRFALKIGYLPTDIEGLKVYVDAGHGGSDPGALGNGYKEADLTAELAKKVGECLSSGYGIPSYVNTSGNDYKLRHPEAKAMDCGLFVSIHFNSLGGTGRGTGTESYIHSINSAAGSKTLQHATHTRLVLALGLTDRKEKDAMFAVVSGPLPSVLLEVCFIDNASDMSTYNSKKDAVARAIAEGIAEA